MILFLQIESKQELQELTCGVQTWTCWWRFSFYSLWVNLIWKTLLLAATEVPLSSAVHVQMRPKQVTSTFCLMNAAMLTTAAGLVYKPPPTRPSLIYFSLLQNITYFVQIFKTVFKVNHYLNSEGYMKQEISSLGFEKKFRLLNLLFNASVIQCSGAFPILLPSFFVVSWYIQARSTGQHWKKQLECSSPALEALFCTILFMIWRKEETCYCLRERCPHDWWCTNEYFCPTSGSFHEKPPEPLAVPRLPVTRDYFCSDTHSMSRLFWQACL